MKDDPLNLTNIKYFCDTVRLGSVSGAARANFVTQSAISQGITKLEKSIGASLVAHHPNRFRITPQGEEAYRLGLSLLKQSVAFKESVTIDGVKCIGSLDFACTYSFALAVIPEYLKKFREAYPEARVNFSVGKNDPIKQMLKLGSIDFGILPDEGDLEGFEKIDIYKGTFNLYTSSKLKAAEKKKLGFILAESNCAETIVLKEAFSRKFGKEIESILEVNSWEVIANLVSEGMGIGYLPDYIGKKKDNLAVYDLGLSTQICKICVVFLPGMKLRKSSEIFISYFNP